MSKNSELNEVLAALRGAERVAVVSHVRPDGDTLGSNLGLAAVLRRLGKQTASFCEDKVPAKFSYLEGFAAFNRLSVPGAPEGPSSSAVTAAADPAVKRATDGEASSVAATTANGADFDLVVAVDCGDLLRLGEYAKLFKGAPLTLNIDHHISNDYFAKLNFVEYYASTCEIIFELTRALGVELDEGIAKCLYTGLSTDTGNFMHSNTGRREFLTAAALSEHIANLSELTTVLYKEMPKARFDLLCAVLPTIRYRHDNRLAMLTVRDDVLRRTGAETSFTEGFVDYAINIEGVEVGVCVMESGQNAFKVSFRSKRSNVCKLAERFGGGGHEHAAGCRICGFYEDVLDKIARECGILFEEEEQEARTLRCRDEAK